MAKHKRYSRKRSQRRNRRASKKMRGGLVENDRDILQGLGFTQEQIDYLFQQHPDMMVEFFQNSINPPPNNPFFSEQQTPEQIITALQAIDDDIDNVDETLNTTRESISQFSNNSLNNSRILGISGISGYEENDMDDEPGVLFSDDEDDDEYNTTLESVGGKRKTKRRSTNKRHTNKRKTKKSKKTRKYRRKQRGGDSIDTEYLNVNERDKKDYDQMINSLNWDPKQ